MELEIGNNTAWYIVKFLEENSVEAVPVNWFNDLNHCYWPPYKDTVVAEAIRLNEVPSKSWKLYNCKLLSKSKIVDYPTAMKKACRAQYESELSEAESATNNSIKRIKKKNKKYDDTMSDEEYSTPNKRTKLIPFPPTFVNSANAIGNVDIIHKEKTKEEEIIYRQFPITCLEHFNKLDDELKQIKLSKVDVYDALVKNMSLIGGSSFSELLRRILKTILTNQVAEQFSWFGRQKKLSFATTALADLVKSAVKIKYKEETDKHIECVAGTWLAKAKERMKNPTTN
ncbi:hypothetical protein ACI65C_002039 [Semiaphis heraclei]